nr:Sec-independent protein translocase component TatC [Guinardia striata]
MPLFKRYSTEIINRTLIIITSWSLYLGISYYYKQTILYIIIKPSLNQVKQKTIYFIYTNIHELFYTYLTLIISVANTLSAVIIIFNIYNFLKPSLYKTELLYAKKISQSLIFIWSLSLLLLYLIILPLSWNFFIKLQESINKSYINFFFEAKLNEYLSFITSIFNMCLFNTIIICTLFGLVHNTSNIKNFISNQRKNIYLLFFIIASIITPPDVISQLILGSLSILSFEIYVYFLILKINYLIKVTN